MGYAVEHDCELGHGKLGNRPILPAKNRSSPAIVGLTATPPMIARGPIDMCASEMAITMTPNSVRNA